VHERAQLTSTAEYEQSFLRNSGRTDKPVLF